MNETTEPSVLVDRVVRSDQLPLALHVTAPSGVDLQFIYRAAMHVHWDSESSCLVDRFDGESSTSARFRRVARAVKCEYGLSLRASSGIVWEGVGSADRSDIEGQLAGLTR